jgi:hypothetical protein
MVVGMLTIMALVVGLIWTRSRDPTGA